ncbi:MAG: hypothetical protein HRT89_03615 [Lentisphaeria bacterium]|nr:hypothetical protein [Lentisphaeria bacterium]NQZ67137.1 hypothetical protein [Lentisphaeria bacterium]
MPSPEIACVPTPGLCIIWVGCIRHIPFTVLVAAERPQQRRISGYLGEDRPIGKHGVVAVSIVHHIVVFQYAALYYAIRYAAGN